VDHSTLFYENYWRKCLCLCLCLCFFSFRRWCLSPLSLSSDESEDLRLWLRFFSFCRWCLSSLSLSSEESEALCFDFLSLSLRRLLAGLGLSSESELSLFTFRFFFFEDFRFFFSGVESECLLKQNSPIVQQNYTSITSCTISASIHYDCAK
jgi:hypothetical protein